MNECDIIKLHVTLIGFFKLCFISFLQISIFKSRVLFLQAKPYLEKAMKMDASNLEPVYVLAEILGQEKQFDKGIEM